MARILNLGILAHVDAGKTSLTERLLYAAGIIDEVGSVDDGSTQTDSLELERRRGITIKSAVVSFVARGTTINLIDTPGHPDFIAEVERVLSVLDGAVLVISAVEGVQAQTRVLFRTLRRLGIPTLIFVNKIDRTGAREAGVLAEIAARLSPDIVAMNTVSGNEVLTLPAAARTTALAEHDDELLAAYVDDIALPASRLDKELAAQTAGGRIHPVFFGSAITGAGVDELQAGITDLLPAAAPDPAAWADDRAVAATRPQGQHSRGSGDVSEAALREDAAGVGAELAEAASGTVFKVDRGAAGERIAYVRMFAGALRVRDKVGDGKVTGIRVFEQGATVERQQVGKGEIALLRGLPGIRIGDSIGTPPAGATAQFAPPSLETVVVPVRRAEKGALQAALAQLAEQDPLINLRQDDLRDEVYVSLYGEVQKEVIQATLADGYGLDVTFRETTTICVERPAGVGEAYEMIGVEPNAFLATVGLRVEPAAVGSGLEFRLGVELGSMPIAFFRAVEETLHEALGQGLHGWRVTDLVVTMTRSGYWPRQSRMHGTFDKSMSSTAGDFRNLTPLVLMAALREAGTRVLEPIHAFQLELPADTLPAVLPVLAHVGGVPLATTARGIDGEIPAAKVHELQQALPSLTRGEGVLASAFERYAPVRGPAPERPRTDNNPLDRKEYLLRVVRRTGTAART